EKSLDQGDLVAVTADDAEQFAHLLKHFQAGRAPRIIPVYYSPPIRLEGERHQRNRVVVGDPLSPTATPDEVRHALRALQEWLDKQDPAKSVGPEASLLLGQGLSGLKKRNG